MGMASVLLLLIIVVAMMCGAYVFFKKEITSPTFICTAMYALSLFLMLLYSEEWEVNLSFKTYSIIIVALVFLWLGEYIAMRAAPAFGGKRLLSVFVDEDKNSQETLGIQLSEISIAICFIFVSLTAILYLRDIQNIVANSEYAQSEYGQEYTFLRQFSWAQILEGAEVSYLVQQMFTLSGVIAFVLSYVVIYNMVYGPHRRKRHPFAYLTIIVYVGSSFLTSGRALMLNFFIYCIFVWLILLAKKKNWTFNNNIKLLIRAALIIVIAILLFYLAGILTGKTSSYTNFMDIFANYFSSSIYGLNEYLNNPSEFMPDTDFFGVHTLSGLYTLLRTLGFPIPDSIVALEYIECGDYLTNIYTPLRRYFQDFGWIGLCLIMFLIGYFYKRLVWKNKSKNSCGLDVIFAAYFMFPLVYIAIEERVFMDVIMMRSIYQIIYIIFVYQWLVNKKFYTKRIQLRYA